MIVTCCVFLKPKRNIDYAHIYIYIYNTNELFVVSYVFKNILCSYTCMLNRFSKGEDIVIIICCDPYHVRVMSCSCLCFLDFFFFFFFLIFREFDRFYLILFLQSNRAQIAITYWKERLFCDCINFFKHSEIFFSTFLSLSFFFFFK